VTANGMHTMSVSLSRERGAALVVGLLMLVVLTVLAITGMSTSTMELAMAGNNQHSNRAFEATSSVLEAEIRRTDIQPLAAAGNLTLIAGNQGRNYRDGAGNPVATASARTAFLATTGTPGWQLGMSHAFSAYHFEASANGTAAKGASTSQLQGYYVIGPTP
jgi:type IV pilus assembly protein PilX